MPAEKFQTNVRKEQIIRAAMGLIASCGVKGLNMAGIAHRVGLVPSATYRHFKNKQALMDAVLDYIGDRLVENAQEVLQETDEAPERLRRLLMKHAKLIRENEAIPHIIFSEDVYFGDRERKSKMESILKGYLDRVARLIREGQKTGQIDPDLDPATLSVMFLGLIQPAAILWHLSEGRFNVTRHADMAWRVFSKALSR